MTALGMTIWRGLDCEHTFEAFARSTSRAARRISRSDSHVRQFGLIWSACGLRSTCTPDCVADRASRYEPIGSDQGGFGRDYRSVPPPTKDVGTGLPW
jgi:hypothetical protein